MQRTHQTHRHFHPLELRFQVRFSASQSHISSPLCSLACAPSLKQLFLAVFMIKFDRSCGKGLKYVNFFRRTQPNVQIRRYGVLDTRNASRVCASSDCGACAASVTSRRRRGGSADALPPRCAATISLATLALVSSVERATFRKRRDSRRRTSSLTTGLVSEFSTRSGFDMFRLRARLQFIAIQDSGLSARGAANNSGGDSGGAGDVVAHSE